VKNKKENDANAEEGAVAPNNANAFLKKINVIALLS
jgi:hypothetical protein